MGLSAQTGVELPISAAVYRVLYEGLPARQAMEHLFSRSLKQEFNPGGY
jgi:glycerol-3-phosphate dehydrogenase (NAD(P)+)